MEGRRGQAGEDLRGNPAARWFQFRHKVLHITKNTYDRSYAQNWKAHGLRFHSLEGGYISYADTNILL